MVQNQHTIIYPKGIDVICSYLSDKCNTLYRYCFCYFTKRKTEIDTLIKNNTDAIISS